MWISKEKYVLFIENARFEGMSEAADSIIRGLSPYYEGRDGSIPGPVVKALATLEEALKKSKDFRDLANNYQGAMMLLGSAIGMACEEKAKIGT
jgi:hypothetical protein